MLKELLTTIPTDNARYEAEIELLRTQMLRLQYDLLQKNFSVVVVFAGDDGIAASRMLNKFYEWLDAHYLSSKVFPYKTPQFSGEIHDFQKYWNNLPPKGEIAFFINAWSSHYLFEKLLGNVSEKDLNNELEEILAFESTLSDNQTVFLKFWLHTGKDKLKKRLKKAKKNPDKYWWVQKKDWILFKNYDKFIENAEEFIRKTDKPNSRWHLIDSNDFRERDLHVAKILLSELRYKADNYPQLSKGEALVSSKIDISSGLKNILDEIDLSQKIAYEKYDKLLKSQQNRISAAMTKCHKKGITNIIVMEGWDAAGKGGAVRRLINAMDAQYYEVTNTAAPTEEEKRYHYLRRFWKNLPSRGHCKIFDRSWYGRVLVERVEGFAAEEEWERAFSEIVDFEHQLTQENVILHKFWLHISPEEQIRRFHKRESITYKNYKITPEDYRNREKWDYYKFAVQDMIIRTSTPDAPWRIIAAEDKKFARVQVLKHIADRIEDFFAR